MEVKKHQGVLKTLENRGIHTNPLKPTRYEQGKKGLTLAKDKLKEEGELLINLGQVTPLKETFLPTTRLSQ
jgi:hypothetical protein